MTTYLKGKCQTSNVRCILDPLGRGLESLIPDKNSEDISANLVPPTDSQANDGSLLLDNSSAVNETKTDLTFEKEVAKPVSHLNDHFAPKRNDSIFWIEVEKIESNPYQPRREFNEDALKDLARSIREHGVLQPILVTKKELETSKGIEVKYQLIAGERRWRAARLAGLTQIPAVIRRGMPDDRIKLELALIENVQREDLNAIERAKAFRQLLDEFHLVQKDVADRIGKSREMVANTLRLLALPNEVQQAVLAGNVTEGHARAILMVGDDTQKQMEVFNAILFDRLNVREAESKARQISGKVLTPRSRIYVDPETKEWQKKLQEKFGTKVLVQKKGDRGKIVVEFYSDEELRGILDKLIRES